MINLKYRLYDLPTIHLIDILRITNDIQPNNFVLAVNIAVNNFLKNCVFLYTSFQ